MNLFRVLFAAAVLASSGRAQAADELEDYRPIYKQLVQQHGASAVTVKFVMAVTNSGAEQRIEDRAQGLLVQADGLVLVPDRAVSLDFNQLAGANQGQGTAPVAKSSDFRVRLPGSEDWRAADLVTRDSELGLAWLRLREVPAGLGFVDLAQGVRAEPGMVFFSLMRTSDEWGGVPVFRPGLVLGETRTPRAALLVDGVPGLAFSSDGRPMGYVDVNLSAMMRGRGGLGLDMADMALRMIPVEKVAAATALAAKLPVAGK